MTKITSKKHGLSIELPEFTQRQLEDYYRELRELVPDPDAISVVEYTGNVTRAAKTVGWLNGIGEVGDLAPGAVLAISRGINNAIAEALTIDPEA